MIRGSGDLLSIIFVLTTVDEPRQIIRLHWNPHGVPIGFLQPGTGPCLRGQLSLGVGDQNKLLIITLKDSVTDIRHSDRVTNILIGEQFAGIAEAG